MLQVADRLNILLLYYTTLYNKLLCILANKQFYSIENGLAKNFTPSHICCKSKHANIA